MFILTTDFFDAAEPQPKTYHGTTLKSTETKMGKLIYEDWPG